MKKKATSSFSCSLLFGTAAPGLFPGGCRSVIAWPSKLSHTSSASARYFCYAVEVNNAAATYVRHFRAALVALALCTTTAVAGPFSDLVIFGDSLSDIGNISQATFGTVPGPYYWNGRVSNGPVYAEPLAVGLGLPAITRSTAGGHDFAYGGAQTTGTGGLNGLFVKDIDEQVTQFLSSQTANATSLYVVFAGANDLVNGQTNVSVPVNSLNASIDSLIAAGARRFLVFNLPLLGNTPRYHGLVSTRDEFNTLSQQYNSDLAAMLDTVQDNHPAVTLYRFDVSTIFGQLLANPALFGLANATDPAAPGLALGATSYDTNLIAPNPNEYVFWDDLHPTTAVHSILAQRALDLFRLPGDFNHDETVDAADYVAWRKDLGAIYIPYDYEVWRAHFGQSATGAAVGESATIPEPTAFFLNGLAAIALAVSRFARANPQK